MAIRRLCVQEITDITQTQSLTITCFDPPHTPIGQGNPSECNVVLYNLNFDATPLPTISFSYDVQFKYAYEQNGATFEGFCNVNNQSGSITFNGDIELCDCEDAFNMTGSVTCDPSAITTTPTSVSGPVTFTFDLENLCAQTIICVDDTTCL